MAAKISTNNYLSENLKRPRGFRQLTLLGWIRLIYGVCHSGLSSNLLRCDFELGNGLSCRVFECPSRTLPETELQQLVADLQSIAACNPEPLKYGVFSNDPHALDNRIVTIIYDQRLRRPAAFSALCYLPIWHRSFNIRVLHMGLSIVHPLYRQRGFTHLLYALTLSLVLLHHRFRSFWISHVTQVPSAVGMLCEACNHVYPSPDTVLPTPLHSVIADTIMRDYRHEFGVGSEAIFDKQSQIIKNSYTGGSDGLKKSFAEVPKHRNQKYNRMCQDALDYDRGDDFLLIGQWSTLATLRYMLNKIRFRWHKKHLKSQQAVPPQQSADKGESNMVEDQRQNDGQTS